MDYRRLTILNSGVISSADGGCAVGYAGFMRYLDGGGLGVAGPMTTRRNRITRQHM